MIKQVLFFFLSVTSLLASNASNNVTVREYTDFLNIVAKEDRHLLYDQKMGEDHGTPKIIRSGSPGNYSYYFREEDSEESVLFVDVRSAMRFCNWKENGGQEDPATTEYGVYELEGDELLSISIDENTNYFLPSKDAIGTSSSKKENWLRLGALDEPSSWARSNQLVFHLQGALENIVPSANQENQASWWDDAESVGVAIVSLATIAVYFKYRGQGCYPGGEREQQLSDKKRRRSDEKVGDVGNSTRRDASQVGVTELQAKTETPVAKESQKKDLEKELQDYINKEIYPRTVMIDKFPSSDSLSHGYSQLGVSFNEQPDVVRNQGELFNSLFQQNFEKIFGYKERTKSLQDLMEAHMETLKKTLAASIRQKISLTIFDQIFDQVRHFLSADTLEKKHLMIMKAGREYCADFDRSRQKSLQVTKIQHDFFEQLQKIENEIDRFSGDTQAEVKSIDEMLQPKSTIPIKRLRAVAMKKFFDTTFKDDFLAGTKRMEDWAQAAKDKFRKLHQQLKELSFWNDRVAEGARQKACAIISLANQEREEMLRLFNEWKIDAQHVLQRAAQWYDAVNHVFPELQNDSTITGEQRDLVIRAVQDVNTSYATASFYPPEENEQPYLEGWVGEQYEKVKKELQSQRSWFRLDTYISPMKGTLPEYEKEVLRYFLKNVENSPVDFIRAKGALLRSELNRDSEGDFESSDSDNSL